MWLSLTWRLKPASDSLKCSIMEIISEYSISLEWRLDLNTACGIVGLKGAFSSVRSSVYDCGTGTRHAAGVYPGGGGGG